MYGKERREGKNFTGESYRAVENLKQWFSYVHKCNKENAAMIG